MIELDGEIHNKPEVKERDDGREFILKNFGLNIVRFTNHQILTDIENVILELNLKIEQLT